MAKFNRDEFLLASAKVSQHGRGIDKLHGKASVDKAAWATQAALGVQEGKLSLDDIKRQLITDTFLALPKAEQDDIFDPDSVSNFKEFVGQTVNGWFHDLRRCIEAGPAFVKRVADGEAVTTVRRETNATQGKGKGKGASPKAKQAKPLPTFAEATAAMRGYVQAATADTGKAMQLAANAELAGLIADIGKLEAKVAAATASENVAKAA